MTTTATVIIELCKNPLHRFTRYLVVLFTTGFKEHYIITQDKDCILAVFRSLLMLASVWQWLTMAVLQDQMQAEVLLRVVQPEVTGGGQVKGQPALLCRPQFSLFQQQELHFAEERRVCNRIQGISRLKALNVKTWWSVEYPCLAADWNIQMFLGYNIKDLSLLVHYDFLPFSCFKVSANWFSFLKWIDSDSCLKWMKTI